MMFTYSKQTGPAHREGFTLVEMMVVVVIILVLTGATALMFANSSDSVRLRRDSTSCVAFLRNMWDSSKASGEPIVLIPDFESGQLSYLEPRSGITEKANFVSKARVLAIVVNDRLIHANSEQPDIPADQDDIEDPILSGVYLSEGRGLSRVGVVLGIPVSKELEDGYKWITLARINLITGRSELLDLEPEEFDDMMNAADELAEERLLP